MGLRSAPLAPLGRTRARHSACSVTEGSAVSAALAPLRRTRARHHSGMQRDRGFGGQRRGHLLVGRVRGTNSSVQLDRWFDGQRRCTSSSDTRAAPTAAWSVTDDCGQRRLHLLVRRARHHSSVLRDRWFCVSPACTSPSDAGGVQHDRWVCGQRRLHPCVGHVRGTVVQRDRGFRGQRRVHLSV